jgi:hypothetical protein
MGTEPVSTSAHTWYRCGRLLRNGPQFSGGPEIRAGSAGAIGGHVELLRKICAQQYELKAGAPEVVQEHAPDLIHIISIDIQFSSVIVCIVARACKKKR